MENKNKIKRISKSQSKHNEFEEYEKCLYGKKIPRESNNYILRSINHEMQLREITKKPKAIFFR